MDAEHVIIDGDKTNAPIHDELNTPQGELYSDVSAILSAISRGATQDVAISLYGSTRAKNWITKNGLVLPK